MEIITSNPAKIKINSRRLLVRATPGSSGYDLRASNEISIILKPGATILVPTGIRVEMPIGVEAQIRPRSGLALKHGIMASFGTIDADYRGEIGVILFNLGKEDFPINPGDRVAQLVFASVLHPTFVEVSEEELTQTTRGTGGFGSTGI